MKKFLSMLLCVAMVLSFVTVSFAAESTSATVSFDDTANRKVFTAEQQVWAQNGITVTNDKAASRNEVADYAKPARFYQGSSLKIEYKGMKAIEIDVNTGKPVAGLTDSLKNIEGITVTTKDNIVTITFATAVDSFVIESLAAQVRFNKLTVYTGDVTTQPETPETPETPEEPKVPATLAEQIAEANKLANKAYLPYESTITGTITDDPAKGQYNDTEFKFTVSDGTNTLLCYYVPVTGGTPAKGDKVTVTGKLTAYNGAAQFDSTAAAVVEKTATPENPETPEEPEKPAATVVDAPVVGTAYKFGMVQQNASNKTYYLKGGMSSYYMATSDDITQAIDVYLEATEGGYYLYTMEGETKTYINMVVSGTHVNGKYEATASTVYTYDATKKTVIAKVNDKDYWFGTRNDKNYTTVGPCDVSYNGFYCQFYTVAGAVTPEVNPDEEAAKAVVDQIAAIGTVTKDSKAAIEAARAAYDALSDDAKKLVTNVDVLTAAEKTLEELNKPTEPEQPAASNKADFDTIVLPSSKPNGDSSYTATYKTANGWTSVNCAIQCGGAKDMNPQYVVIGPDNTHKAVCLNGGKTVGKLTSPTLTGGISKLTMEYTKMFSDTLMSVTITITDLSNGKTYTKTVSREEDKDTKYVVWTDEWVLETPITGDFTIEIVNNCPSGGSTTKNLDRVTILELAWESAPKVHEHKYEAITTATCVADGITTYTCECGDTYTEETAKLGHIDENLDVDCDRDGCTSKVAPPANSLLSNFTANNLGSKLSSSNQYYVQGTIVEVLDAKNGIFLIDDGTGERFYFRLPKNADGVEHAKWAIKLTLGDKVKVYGKINKYSTKDAPNGQYWPAIQSGVVTLLEQHPHDFTFSAADCRNPATCACGQTNGAPRGCVDADANNICDDCGKNTKYTYEYVEIRTDNNSGVHDATALTYTWTNGNFGVQVAKASGGNLYVTSNNHMRLYKNNQFVLTNKNGLAVKTIIVYLTNATQVANFEKMLTGYTYTKNEEDFSVTVQIDSLATLTLTNSGSTTQIKGVEFGYERQETVDETAAKAVVDQIAAIGEVKLESKAAIEAARAAYNALSEEAKKLVTNENVLAKAEADLKALEDQAAQAAADKAAADAVIVLIDAIGEVKPESGDAIKAARAAYDKLTDAQKRLVTNVDVLTKAEDAYKGVSSTGDNMVLFFALTVLSMAAVVVLVSKKREF